MKTRIIGATLLVVVCGIALGAQDAVTLKFGSKVGDIHKYKMHASLEAGGGNAEVSGDFTDKVTKVEEDSYTIEQTESNVKVSFNGQDIDQPDSVETTVRKMSGEITDVQTDQDSAAARRTGDLVNFVFPDKPVKVGDEWTYKVKADDKKGAVAATATYKVESTEKVGTHDTLKIKNSYKEDGTDPASSEGFYWIDVKDGSLVKSTQTWTNVPIGPVVASGTITMESVD